MVIDTNKINKLYFQDGLSAREIGKKFNMTVWQVIKFMKRYNIPRRSQSETRKLQFLRSPQSFSKKIDLNISENELNIAGHMLYWAEGAKKNSHTVDFANSNVEMNKLFLKMLRKVYRVDENRLKILLYCHADQNTDALVTFWAKTLKISISCFSNPYIRKDFDSTKKNVMEYGLVHIRYNDIRLLEQIKNEIDIIQRRLLIS